AMIESTTRLNSMGADLPAIDGVHAVTDVTGFGLLGHALEIARGSRVTVEISAGAPALLEGVEALARSGVRTGASGRNWESYGASVRLPDGFDAWRRDMLTDPQTSGGLLIAASPKSADEVLALARAQGFAAARIVGRVVEGAPEARLVP